MAGGLVFAVVGLILGIRLLALARRTRGLPELLLAVALLCGGFGLGFLRVMAMHAPLSESLLSAAALGVAVCRGLATGSVVVLIWRVFAPDRLWASTLSGVLLLGIALLLAAEVREMRPAATSHPLYWLWNGLMMVSFGWGWRTRWRRIESSSGPSPRAASRSRCPWCSPAWRWAAEIRLPPGRWHSSGFSRAWPPPPSGSPSSRLGPI